MISSPEAVQISFFRDVGDLKYYKISNHCYLNSRQPSKWRNKFELNSNTGMITMKRGITLPNELNTFELEFVVEDPTHKQYGKDAVSANVKVTIKRITKEAVLKSGSMRIKGTPEDFVRENGSGMSKRTAFIEIMKNVLNATHVDVFTVLRAGTLEDPLTDVRFSAHGSPYYAPERLEGVLAQHKKEIEQNLNIEIVLIRIDECLYEGQHCEGKSCVNQLDIIEDQPITILTNRTSFVGVQAVVKPVCQCSAPSQVKELKNDKLECAILNFPRFKMQTFTLFSNFELTDFFGIRHLSSFKICFDFDEPIRATFLATEGCSLA